MNLNEALSRNRVIFEKLTGIRVYTEPKQKEHKVQIGQNQHHEETLPKEPMKRPVYEEGERRPVFSLKHASPSDKATLDFDAPGAVAYPEIPLRRQSAAADPLESLYYRLEVDARRGSQLLNEEE